MYTFSDLLLEIKLWESNEQWSKHCVWGSKKSPRGFGLFFWMVTRKCQQVQRHLQRNSPQQSSAGSHPIPKSHSNDFTLSGPHSPGKLKEHRLIGFRKERAWNRNPKTSGWRLKELPEDQGKGDGCWVSKLFPPDGSIASCVNKREHRVCIALQWTNETSVWEMRTQDTVTCQLQ